MVPRTWEYLSATWCMGAMIEVRASCQAQRFKELKHRVDLFKGINQPGLFPIAQALQVDAPVFFYEFIRLVQEVVLQLQAVQVASECVDLSLRFFVVICLGRFQLACHGRGCLEAEQLVPPVVQRWPANAQSLRDCLCAFL